MADTVATDGSAGASRAVDMAIELARALNGEFLILTVGGDISWQQRRQLERAEGSAADAIEALANKLLDQSMERAERAGVPNVQTLGFAWGDPAETIIEAARLENADMIVVGRRGHGRLAGLLLGSVSQKVVTLAPWVVVVVP